MIMKNLFAILLMFCTLSVFAQSNSPMGTETKGTHKYRVSLPVITLPQLFTKSWDDRTHTQHIELHIKRNLDDKNILGAKAGYLAIISAYGY
jgi:hypothetical protein